MAISWSNLVDNMTDGIDKIKYESVNDNFIKYKCLFCNKIYWNKIDETIKKRFNNTFKFSNNDFNKSIFLLGKGVYPDEYMDDWEKFAKTALHEKEDFYSNLNMEDIADADYIYEKRVCKDFRKLRLKICH